MVYKSYDTSKQKLRTLWEENDKQEEEIDKLTIINLDFNSLTFRKNIYTDEKIVYIKPYLTSYYTIINFDNFPDWIMPYINIALIAGNENKITQSEASIANSFNIEIRKFWETKETIDDEGNIISSSKVLQYFFEFDWYVATDIKILIKIVNPRNYHEVRKFKT